MCIAEHTQPHVLLCNDLMSPKPSCGDSELPFHCPLHTHPQMLGVNAVGGYGPQSCSSMSTVLDCIRPTKALFPWHGKW